jgi:hypothetical protein
MSTNKDDYMVAYYGKLKTYGMNWRIINRFQFALVENASVISGKRWRNNEKRRKSINFL